MSGHNKWSKIKRKKAKKDNEMREGFLERTSRRRVATARAYAHLGHDVPKDRDLGL